MYHINSFNKIKKLDNIISLIIKKSIIKKKN